MLTCPQKVNNWFMNNAASSAAGKDVTIRRKSLREIICEGETAAIAKRQAEEHARALEDWKAKPADERGDMPIPFNYYQTAVTWVIDNLLTAEDMARYSELRDARNAKVRGLDDWLQ